MTRKKFEPRRAEPRQTFTHIDADGSEHTFRADEDGVVRPAHACEQRHADSLGLPVARSVKQAEKAEKES